MIRDLLRPIVVPRCQFGVACLGLVPLLPGPEAGAPHPGPPVYVECEISAEEVSVRFTGEQQTLLRWFGYDGSASPFAAPLAPEDIESLAESIRSTILGRNEITVDDERPEFVIDGIDVPPDELTGYGLPALTFTLRTSRTEAPRRMGVVWSTWEGLAWFEQVKLPVLFRSFGDAQLVFLTPDEPGYVWHAESVVPREPPEIVQLEGPPPRRIGISMASAGIAVLSLGALAVGLWRRLHWVGLLIVLLIGTAGSFAARGVTRVEFDNPFYPSVTLPDAEEAAALFEQLQRNVYGAFDARSETEVYDLLAVSVVPALLDELYGQVYESLIMRGQGGAVCQIERMEVRSSAVDLAPVIEPWDIVELPDEESPCFRVDQDWDVHGVVSHWGHEHRRINHYRALYTVAHDGTSWKIAGVEILDHSQVDSDG